MNNSDMSSAGRALRTDPIARTIVARLSTSQRTVCRSPTRTFEGYARRLIPRCVDETEWQRRMGERVGSVDQPDASRQNQSEYDKYVYAIKASFGSTAYSLPQTMSVLPHLETFISDGVNVELISDRLVIIHSELKDSPSRTAVLDRLTNGFFSAEALSSCPKIEPGSELSRRNLPRMQRLKKSLAQTQYIRFTNPSPVNGPHALHDGATGIVYNLASFGRLIRERTSTDPSEPVSPIETIGFNLLNDDRLTTYRRIAKLALPDSSHGVSSVLISSPEKAPDFFDLVSDDDFPGQLTKMKHLGVDVSVPGQSRVVPDASWLDSSPDLESVTFRLQRSRTSDMADADDPDDPAVDLATEEVEEEGPDLTADDLVRPFLGSSTRVAFIAAPGNDELSELCNRATAALRAR